jgi:hypothetical protein
MAGPYAFFTAHVYKTPALAKKVAGIPFGAKRAAIITKLYKALSDKERAAFVKKASASSKATAKKK